MESYSIYDYRVERQYFLNPIVYSGAVSSPSIDFPLCG